MPSNNHAHLAWLFLTASACMLIACGEESAQTHDDPCKEVMSVFAIRDWQTLVTGSFVENLRGGPGVGSRAPAKTLIKGFDSCEISRLELAPHIPGSASEILTFECCAPVSAPQGEDLLTAAKAFAAPWRSCFGGWKDTAEFHYFDSRNPSLGALAQVKFTKDQQSVIFQSTVERSETKPNTIALRTYKMR